MSLSWLSSASIALPMACPRPGVRARFKGLGDAGLVALSLHPAAAKGIRDRGIRGQGTGDSFGRSGWSRCRPDPRCTIPQGSTIA